MLQYEIAKQAGSLADRLMFMLSPHVLGSSPSLHLASCWQTKWNHPTTTSQGCEIWAKLGGATQHSMMERGGG